MKQLNLIRTILQCTFFVGVIVIALVTCASEEVSEETPTATPVPTLYSLLGSTYQGEMLELTLEKIIRVNEVAYTEEPDADGEEKDHIIKPSSRGNEIIAIRVQVGNHATERIELDVTAQRPQILTDSGWHPGINTFEAGVPTEEFHAEQNVYIPFIRGSQRVDNGFELDGWLIFEVPRDSKIWSFRWEAGEEITIDARSGQ